MAEGVIEAFSWEVIPKNQPPSKKEEAPAFKAWRKFAEDLFNSLPDTPPAAAAPHQKSRWAWWVAGGIVVLGYLLFKNN
jgi:hypothetical protein